ncbi:hypothetical protein TNCV_2214371 [Trichonephila clavipes]|nr:hypothetical protein TNCV_2214371 [Trichonephila clavipes]
MSVVHRLQQKWLEQGNVASLRDASATSACMDRRIRRQAVATAEATPAAFCNLCKISLVYPYRPELVFVDGC